MQSRKLPPKYDRRCRDLPPTRSARGWRRRASRRVVRFKTPLTGQTAFHDLVRGDIVFENDTLDDFVLLKSDGFPAYHLANVVDDHLMEITHVLRGDEWLSSTPRHVLLYAGVRLGAARLRPPADDPGAGPRQALQAPRRHLRPGVPRAGLPARGAVQLPRPPRLVPGRPARRSSTASTSSATSAWSASLANPAVFNLEKLTWMNGVYIRELPDEDAGGADCARTWSAPSARAGRTATCWRASCRSSRSASSSSTTRSRWRTSSSSRRAGLRRGRRCWASSSPARPASAAAALQAVVERVEGARAPGTHEALEGAIRPLAEELALKAGDLFGLIRVAVTGKTGCAAPVRDDGRPGPRAHAGAAAPPPSGGFRPSLRRTSPHSERFLGIMSARYIMLAFRVKPLDCRRACSKILMISNA